ncbi:MAG: hypothetical protein ACQESR_05370 [Planctomycetota bacterium]
MSARLTYTSGGRICPNGKLLDASRQAVLPLVGVAAAKLTRDRYRCVPMGQSVAENGIAHRIRARGISSGDPSWL